MVNSPVVVNQTEQLQTPEKHNKRKPKICHCAKPETFQRIFFSQFPEKLRKEESQFLQFSQVKTEIILIIQKVAFDPLGRRYKTI